MEIELKKESMEGYESAADFTAQQEESLELIVPDQQPDIGRILTAEHAVFLRTREIRDGRAELSGTLSVSALYAAESGGLQTLRFAMPFVLLTECPADCACLRAEIHAENLSVRMLNSRKIHAQCRLMARILCYRRQTLEYTVGYSAENRYGLESLQTQETAAVIVALPEKEFTFEDTLALPQNRGGTEEILLQKLHGTITETKLFGKKAIVKGNYLLELLLKTEAGRYENTSFELPFSQILDVDAPEENALCQATLQLTGWDCRLEKDGEGAGEIAVSIFTRLLLTISETRQLTLLSDLYSTAYTLETRTVDCKLSDAAAPQVRRQFWQDTLEVGVSPASILSLSAACGAVTVMRGGEGSEHHTVLQLQILYLDDGGNLLSCERSAEVTLCCAVQEGATLRCRALCGAEATAAITAAGIAVRVPVDFILEEQSLRKLPCVCGASFDAEQPKDLSGLPSLILRRRTGEESLWSLAKQYNTTMGEILAANGCDTEQELPAQRMLLIPKRRI